MLVLIVLGYGNLGLAGGMSAWAGQFPEPIRVLVAYHSLTGHTEKMAQAVVAGAQSVPFTVVEIRQVSEVTAEQLFSAHALIVGSPVYWSNMAGPVKTFFDDWQFRFGVLANMSWIISWAAPSP